MTGNPFILATAGHVDHGKSALVRALTGTDPDRLPEEKLRGMTIELGFAHLVLASTHGARKFDIGVVDVPGHEDFVRNMVAGVGSIDAALLVVAADDGWMPQTEEHLQILSYLGVKHGVVALTKSDLAVDLPAVEMSIRDKLRGTPFSEAAILRTSTKTGRGLDELRTALSEMLQLLSPPSDVDKPRLAVDRAFVLKGVGTVVTGTLAGGMLRRGEDVILQPAGIVTRIRGMQRHGSELESAQPGMRVALNLADVAVADGSRRDAAVGRGDVVTTPHVGATAMVFDVLLEQSPRAGAVRLRSGTLAQIHHGTSAIAGRVRLLDSMELGAAGRSLARITLDSLMFALIGDRFVVRDWSERHSVAGGIILDVNPPGKRIRPAQLALLNSRAASPYSVEAFVISQVLRDGFCDRHDISRQSMFAGSAAEASIERACRQGILTAAGPVVAAPQAWERMLRESRQAIDGFHASHPERPGLPLAQLVAEVVRASKPKGVWEAVLQSLENEDFRRDATLIRRTSHRPALPPRLEPAGRRLRAALAKCDLDPPGRQQLATDDMGAQALKFLIANGEAVEIGTDLVLSVEAYSKAVSLVRDHIRRHGPATVSQLKVALGSSRRVMVPLVEKLDRDGITRRHGDLRVLI